MEVENIALVISILAILISLFALFQKRSQFKNQIMPLAEISIGDYEEEIYVRIQNNGHGTMRVKGFEAISKDLTKSNLIDHLNLELPYGLEWENFVEQFEGRNLRVGESLDAIRILGLTDYPTKDHVDIYKSYKQEMREILSRIKIVVNYSDINNRNSYSESRKLDFFSRN